MSLDALWNVLQKLGVPKKMFDVIISFHNGMKASVSHLMWQMGPFCVMFKGLDRGVAFEFHTIGGFYN